MTDVLNNTNLALVQVKISNIISRLISIINAICSDLKDCSVINRETTTKIKKFIKRVNGLESSGYFSYDNQKKLISTYYAVNSNSRSCVNPCAGPCQSPCQNQCG